MTKDHAGRPAPKELSWAVARNDPAAVKALLDRGADVEDVDQYGGTALMTATVNGPEVMRLLIEHGADPHRKNNGGWSAFDYLEAERTENWWLLHEDYLEMKHLLDEAPEIYRRAEEVRNQAREIVARQEQFKAKRKNTAARQEQLKARVPKFRPKPG